MCLTHDLLDCDCGGNGLVSSNKINNYECDDQKSETPLRVNELMKWEHHSSPFNNDLLEVGINIMQLYIFGVSFTTFDANWYLSIFYLYLRVLLSKS